MTTASDQINAALRLGGILAESESPSAAMSAKALEALNQMIDSWSIERLSVFTTLDQVVTWPASTSSGTLGPSGSLVLVSLATAVRPVSLDAATYFTDASTGISYGVQIINEAQYNEIALKTSTSTWPQVIYANMGFPDITLTVYPVPTVALQFHVVSVQVLAQPATLATTLSFPPGYLRAFKFNLACEILSEYGIDPPRRVSRIADVSKRNLKRINNPKDVMELPVNLVARNARFNIFSGTF